MLSSAADISALGLAILKSTLLRPSLTRRWLKPTAFTSDPVAAIGMPWGLRRIPLSTTNSRRTLTAFSKAGSLKGYTTLLTILPDFNLGFSIMLAGDGTRSLGFDFADLLGASIIPAYDTVARDEANTHYCGTYHLAGQPGLNSSLTVTTDPEKPGLGVGPWISNGTDMVDWAYRLQVGSDTPGVSPAVRLYYTGLETPTPSGGKRQAFKAVFEEVAFPAVEGRRFATDCAAWLGVTGVTYGALPLDEFIFEVDSSGKAIAVENLALRVRLDKVS
jgi:hypothetical protein